MVHGTSLSFIGGVVPETTPRLPCNLTLGVSSSCSNNQTEQARTNIEERRPRKQELEKDKGLQSGFRVLSAASGWLCLTRMAGKSSGHAVSMLRLSLKSCMSGEEVAAAWMKHVARRAFMYVYVADSERERERETERERGSGERHRVSERRMDRWLRSACLEQVCSNNWRVLLCSRECQCIMPSGINAVRIGAP